MRSSGKTVHRITCAAGEQMSGRVAEILSELSIPAVLIESGRSVRRYLRAGRFGSSGYVDRLEDTPIELFQFNVTPDTSQVVMERLVQGLEISHPGHGTVYAQEVNEYIDSSINLIELSGIEQQPDKLGFLQDLALITCILSRNGSGQELARLILELGTGVPMVTLGTAGGIRDRLGLLRITIPQQKELVHLMVPELDAEGVLRLLIEKGRLNRPGKGFIYSSKVLCGLLDTSMQIGPQKHTASIEQIIAAIDKLKANTGWLRRFSELQQDNSEVQLQKGCVEISLVCPELGAGKYVESALDAGSEGATVTRVRQMTVKDKSSSESCERAVIIVPREITDQVVDTLRTTDEKKAQLKSLQLHSVPTAFSYRPLSVKNTG